ncbi:MAG: recombination regulator RecX [Rhodocyclaceae bacterium]|nr:recombination regulator RecX [Rhodocyclaceae bacterium]
MLARREHSRAELTRKLSADGTREDIQTMLDQLEQTGLLSDARFAEAYVSSRAARAGNAKLRHCLRARASPKKSSRRRCPPIAIAELERACEVWRRKFGAAPVDRVDYARQARFLQQRGFAADTVRRVLKEMAE